MADQPVQRRKPLSRLSLDEHLVRLQRIADEAADCGKLSTALRAEELIGKALGFYVERHSLEVTKVQTKEQALGRLRELLAAAPDVATMVREVGESTPRLHAAAMIAAGTLKEIADHSVTSADSSASTYQSGSNVPDSIARNGRPSEQNQSEGS